MSNLYLELRPRGAGKTWSIANDICELQKKNVDIPFYYIPHSKREFNTLKNHVKDIGGDLGNIFHLSFRGKFRELNAKYYFDEFDLNGNLTVDRLKRALEYNCWFTGTPSRIRQLEDFNPSEDVLAFLLKINNGFFNMRVLEPLIWNDLPNLLERDKLHYSAFKTQYLAYFLE